MKERLLLIISLFIYNCSNQANPTIGGTKIPNMIKYSIINNNHSNIKVYKYINNNYSSTEYFNNVVDTCNIVFANKSDTIKNIKLDIATNKNVCTFNDTNITSFTLLDCSMLPKYSVKKASDSLDNSSGYILDSRDNNIYHYETFGNQTWITENLRYNSNKYGIYHHITDSIDDFYYSWTNTMDIDSLFENSIFFNSDNTISPSITQGIAPIGWHIPSRNEFQILVNYIKGNNNTLKSGNIWNPIPIKKSKINIIPAGYYCTYTMFYLYERAYFWTSEEKDSLDAFAVSIENDSDDLKTIFGQKHIHFNIRSIKN